MTEQDSFDYVIVGAGSAGCVLANRLTEDASTSVLLLEAGGEDDADEIHIPAAFSSLFKTKWDWNYETSEQKHMGGRKAYWPRMKGLGGCSSMNAMIYIRGNALDYDDWRDHHGATGWGYSDVLPYFARAETNTGVHDKYHGSSGPLHVEDRRYTHELTNAWVDAAVANGLKRNDDFNGESQGGAGLYQVTCKKGHRWSTADGYLRSALDRPNLTVRTNAFVTKIVLDGTRATGVAYSRGGNDLVAHAGKEVILSGGAINSPQLLMLSGIGPAAHLREHGIDVVVDSAGVGENLHDHPVVPVLTYTKGTSDLSDFVNPKRLIQWQVTGRGPLASNVGEGGAFFASKEGLDAPDIQIHVAPTGFYDNGFREPIGQMFTAGVTLVNVASRGRLRLRSANPAWKPDMDPAYFADPIDMDAAVAGIRRTFDIAKESAIGRFLDKPFIPAKVDGVTDTELAEHVRTWSQTLYHPVGTCAMGDSEDSVVDPQLRVRGVDSLRVVDASVMPEVPRGNTNAPTVMVAEKAADLILARTAPTA
ncbi:GMC family oxidoreductase N-terminal domain-containing protein [Antrihabitans sp. YC3-6]|uniref:GMC family oxidoreductase N-terminal domain-containing protein n=1 Tax=Antrihabitans stalagmiti TaxID=2799499 RepID=A0A934U4P3_9NOCA|nr:GMC family oxidoreductase N-terminal domain-containing protein [Antrihabitans stalagmiti]MBJ8340709.1 GMC family oxidoreductase N-terminal domain-containing protein [Antrihabitans stalagmiti]